MGKTILVTGATDGIGLLTAQKFSQAGHTVLLHGRSAEKLKSAQSKMRGTTETYLADLSDLNEVNALSDAIIAAHDQLDVLVNNAGVLKTPHPRAKNGMDTRYVVNTLAPYVLTLNLLPIMPESGRIINLSSAAQAPVDTKALSGNTPMTDMEAYAQSKLAITIWTREMAKAHPDGPVLIAVNPGSLLASKMVKEGFGVEGSDLEIGADILYRTALDAEFADATGKYYDNDNERFANPNAWALDEQNSKQVMDAIAAHI